MLCQARVGVTINELLTKAVQQPDALIMEEVDIIIDGARQPERGESINVLRWPLELHEKSVAAERMAETEQDRVA